MCGLRFWGSLKKPSREAGPDSPGRADGGTRATRWTGSRGTRPSPRSFRRPAVRIPVGEPHPALVERDHARERRELAKEAGERGLLPCVLDVRDEAGHHHQVDRPVAEHAVGDVQARCARTGSQAPRLDPASVRRACSSTNSVSTCPASSASTVSARVHFRIAGRWPSIRTFPDDDPDRPFPARTARFEGGALVGKRDPRLHPLLAGKDRHESPPPNRPSTNADDATGGTNVAQPAVPEHEAPPPPGLVPSLRTRGAGEAVDVVTSVNHNVDVDVRVDIDTHGQQPPHRGSNGRGTRMAGSRPRGVVRAAEAARTTLIRLRGLPPGTPGPGPSRLGTRGSGRRSGS
jgi:hypothetical protein